MKMKWIALAVAAAIPAAAMAIGGGPGSPVGFEGGGVGGTCRRRRGSIALFRLLVGDVRFPVEQREQK